MDDHELLRYSRHILLPQLGIEGQQKLRDARVLIVGAGGLGCPAGLYLGASGLGSLVVADADVVELGNLQRQIAHQTASIGLNKAVSLCRQISEINPLVNVQALPERLAGEGLEAAVSSVGLVLDCSDNFATRHAVNRACVKFRRPLVSGSALGLFGQLVVFDPRVPDAPCYHCLFPDMEEEGLRCSEAGVLSPLVGVIGAMQAVEAIKLLGGIGQPMLGRLLLYDAQDGRCREVRIPRDPACKVCGGKS